jgi:hypothetical protein
MRVLSWPGLLALLLYTGPIGAGEVVVRVGPAENPDDWPDWGGTPDLDLSQEMSLTEAEIQGLFERMRSSDSSTRARAVSDLRRDAPGSVAVLRKVLFRGQGARNGEMKEAMREGRRRAERDKTSTIEGLLSIDPGNQNIGRGAQGAARVLATLLALNDLDTLAGYKVMIDFSPRHAGVFRHEIGNLLVANGMRVMPALVYGRGSKNDAIHMFAVKWIRDMGNPLLSEQLKIKNPRRLAQLLEAYASVNELDAVAVTLSMANHSSLFVRRAARSALKAYGRNALWPARRQYENTFSKAPKADMAVESILAELYKHYDDQRLETTMKRFEEGLTARKAGDFAAMEAAYRDVLKKAPMFKRRGDMAEGFLALSETLDDDQEKKKREAALKMALRVARPDSKEARLARARLLFQEAEVFREAGLVAPDTYERILVLEPNHQGAREVRDDLQPVEQGMGRVLKKALIVSAIIFIVGLLVYFRLRAIAGPSSE